MLLYLLMYYACKYDIAAEIPYCLSDLQGGGHLVPPGALIINCHTGKTSFLTKTAYTVALSHGVALSYYGGVCLPLCDTLL